MAEFVFLDDEQLRKLAKIIYYQEAEAGKHIIFKSEPEYANYLRDCKANYKSVVGLLDAGGEVKRKFEDDSTRAPIAGDIFSCTVNGANFALQAVQSYTLRKNYLSKIAEHVDTLMSALETLDAQNPEEVARLCGEATQYGKDMLGYTRMYRSAASKWLKESGSKFENPVKRYQTKIGYDGPSEKLEDEHKLPGAFKLWTFASWFIDSVFGCGGSATFSTDGHRCYVPLAPDGVVLARRIAHQQMLTN